jgi:hypothetical protein
LEDLHMSMKASRIYGIGLSVLAVSAFVACSSNNDDTGNGNSNNHAGTNSAAGSGAGGSLNTGGSSSSAGTGNGMAGSGTTAGSGTGGAGTAGSGSGGSGGGGAITCAGKKPAGNLITEFADLVPNATNAGQYTFTLGVPGGTFAYQKGVLTVTDMGKALNVKGKINGYDGFGIYTTDCTDASAYTGVSFSIKGNVGTSGTLNFRVQTDADMAVDPVNKKGSCKVPAGTTDTYPLCHPSSKDIMVTADAKTIEVKFADLAGGVPVAAVSGKDIVGFEWAFTWTGAGATEYDADVTIDDLKFLGGAPQGGSGGAGGSGGSGGSGGAGGNAGGGAGGTGGAGGAH